MAETDVAGKPEYKYIGRIPVRNLWLLMFYASDLFQNRGIDNVDVEDSPDDLPNLVAEMLIYAVEQRQRRRLSLGYQTHTAALNRVRGRIDLLTTERRQLTARALIACKFDDLTMDTPRNRFVRSALERISGRTKHELAHRCQSLVKSMKSMGVSGLSPTLREINADRFGYYDAGDRHMVEIAKLVFEPVIPTETSGSRFLLRPERESHLVRKLFERAIHGFYKVVLEPSDWQTSGTKMLKWKTEQGSRGIDKILPKMYTDIILDNPKCQRRIIIDTKFTSILKRGYHRENSLHSKYIYQIYAYLRSQENPGDLMANKAEGLLLHPSIGKKVDESVIIQGHRIRFATVDLTADTKEIRKELLSVIDFG